MTETTTPIYQPSEEEKQVIRDAITVASVESGAEFADMFMQSGDNTSPADADVITDIYKSRIPHVRDAILNNLLDGRMQFDVNPTNRIIYEGVLTGMKLEYLFQTTTSQNISGLPPREQMTVVVREVEGEYAKSVTAGFIEYLADNSEFDINDDAFKDQVIERINGLTASLPSYFADKANKELIEKYDAALLMVVEFKAQEEAEKARFEENIAAQKAAESTEAE